MRTLRALALLTLALARRLLREDLVVRSLAFPVILVAGTLVLTLAAAAFLRGNDVVAVAPSAAPLRADIVALGFRPREEPDPEAALARGAAWAATDGETLWYAAPGPDALRLEASIRVKRAAPWIPEAHAPPPAAPSAMASGRRVVQLMALLYALYGVVFGAGMVVRDRDDGTLEAELALAVPRSVHGAARWLAGTAGLSVFYALGLLLFHALVGVPGVAALLLHGVAASAAATAIGLLSVGLARPGSGFSGPLAAGLSTVTGMMVAGLAAPPVAHVIPLASIASDGGGWEPLVVSAALGAAAITVFARRVGP